MSTHARIVTRKLVQDTLATLDRMRAMKDACDATLARLDRVNGGGR